jgi:DNA-binding transcriptional LysR family regulator
MSFGHLAIAPALPDFVARHPDLRVDLALDDARVDAVEGGFDVTIRIADRLPDSSAIARRIGLARLVVCAAPAYLERAGRPRTPSDLAGHACLIYAHRDRWLFRGELGDEERAVAGPLRANNGDALHAAALAGLGLAQMPALIAGTSLGRGALEVVLGEFEASPASIWALTSPTRHVAAKVRAFVDFLAERFARDPATRLRA